MQRQQKQKSGEEPWLAVSLKAVNWVPGFVIGFLLGLFVDLASARRKSLKGGSTSSSPSSLLGRQRGWLASSANDGEELKVVLVVRQDLKMGAGKMASQCARRCCHWVVCRAASKVHYQQDQRTKGGTQSFKNYARKALHVSNRSLLRQWEQFGQAKIVLTCKNQQEMNKLKGAAEGIGLPTFVVSDAGRTQVLSGSKTVLAIGPGRKTTIDSITGKLRLL